LADLPVQRLRLRRQRFRVECHAHPLVRVECSPGPTPGYEGQYRTSRRPYKLFFDRIGDEQCAHLGDGRIPAAGARGTSSGSTAVATAAPRALAHLLVTSAKSSRAASDRGSTEIAGNGLDAAVTRPASTRAACAPPRASIASPRARSESPVTVKMPPVTRPASSRAACAPPRAVIASPRARSESPVTV